jgi:hypothetical protein
LDGVPDFVVGRAGFAHGLEVVVGAGLASGADGNAHSGQFLFAFAQ